MQNMYKKNIFTVWLHHGEDQEEVLQVRGRASLRLSEQGHKRARPESCRSQRSTSGNNNFLFGFHNLFF
jgi:hypothetical protein